ncbi:MAG: FAD-dependent oxidoreductase, partial [Gaiellaceae bacterium]
EVHDAHEALASARSVLVIGGGVVGVEFAGEIASAFPDHEITIAHAGGTLLDGSKPKVQRKVLQQLTARGVDVRFNRRFSRDGDLHRCEKRDETLQPDIAYVCVGMIPNTEFLQESLPDILDENGLVQVDQYMRVIGYDHLYALGGCSTLDSRKHGYLATVQGAKLADALLRSAGTKKPKPYKKPPLMLITPTGTDTGVAQLAFLVTTAKTIVGIKQKDLGISHMYKTYGTEPHRWT